MVSKLSLKLCPAVITLGVTLGLCAKRAEAEGVGDLSGEGGGVSAGS